MSISLPLLVCHRIKQGLHTLIVRTLRLNHVDNVEFIPHISSGIFNSEIKPLCVISCAVIIFEDEIVLVRADLNGSSKIARFESALKN